MFLLAGQSNIEYMALKNPTGCSTGGPRANVSYFLAAGAQGGTTPFQLVGPFPFATTPLMELGDLLGQAFPQDNVEIVMAARSGSSLLLRNQIPTFESWIDLSYFANPAMLMNRILPALGPLVGADELHIVWGQGESDCLSLHPQPVTTFEYWQWAQGLFAWLATNAGFVKYSVHLVTPGAIETAPPGQTDADADQLRDAYFLMERIPLVLPGLSPTIASVAHHYDIKHDAPNGVPDIYHLSDCGYTELARRIARGITAADSLPKLSGASSVPNATDVVLDVTAPLVTFPIGTSFVNFFAVSVNGTPVSNFQVGTVGQKLTVRIPAGGLTSTTPITIRYVAGSGFGDQWAAGGIGTPAGDALEPFLLVR